MSTKLLGAHLDIHGGGQDLQFPHHENEIAQSEAALDEAGKGNHFVNYWMHNGFVSLHDQKMSKSTGNVETIRSLLKRHDPEVIRFFVVRAHYRSPLNYSEQQLEDARQGLTRLYTSLKGMPSTPPVGVWDDVYGRRFREALDDDFNTPEAVAVLHELANEINRSRSERLASRLRALGGILGLLGRESESFLRSAHGHKEAIDEARITSSIAAREEARKAGNYALADEIRDTLLRQGVILEDGPGGTGWRRV